MTYDITKDKRVFDRDKIDVGDIVAFDEPVWGLFGKSKKSYERVGIVDKVELDCLWIRTQDAHAVWSLDRFGIPIERVNEIRIIYRSYYNVGGGESYGEI